jgi:hypothetical protein
LISLDLNNQQLSLETHQAASAAFIFWALEFGAPRFDASPNLGGHLMGGEEFLTSRDVRSAP